MIFLIAFGTFLATFIGGLFALKFKDKLHLVLGFSAGAVIGVAFFDLLPEAIDLGAGWYEPSVILTYTALGFVTYMIVDRLVSIHAHVDDHCENTTHTHSGVTMGAGSLSAHSFLDGLGIGLAFQASTAIGVIVAVAVLVHDFSDGINTINMVLKNNGNAKQALKWLIVDALAPVLGIIATFFFHIDAAYLALLLAVFGGFFLYIGASDLLPESHHNHPTKWTTFSTVVGIAVIYLAIMYSSV